MFDCDKLTEDLAPAVGDYLESWTSPHPSEIADSLHKLLYACASQEISQAAPLFELAFYQYLVVSSVNPDFSLGRKDAISSFNASLQYSIRGIMLHDILLEYDRACQSQRHRAKAL